MKNYQSTQQTLWAGRVDSHDQYEAFRWHQWVQTLDAHTAVSLDHKLGIGLIGFACDLGVQLNKGRPGASHGPLKIRKELMNLPCHFKEDLKLYDYGDIHSGDADLLTLQDSLAQLVQRALDDKTFPIVLGGGHEVAYGTFNGIKAHVGKASVGIVNFDAHFDIRSFDQGGSSGTMFNQIATDACQNNEEFSYFCLGIQQRGNTRALFNHAKDLGVDYILAREVTQENMVNIFRALDRFMKHKDHIYITICMDVFASAYAPGVSSAQPLGLQPWLLLTVLKYILRSDKVICLDIAEVSPRFDLDNVTANLASTVVFHAVQQLAENKDLDYEDIL